MPDLDLTNVSPKIISRALTSVLLLFSIVLPSMATEPSASTSPVAVNNAKPIELPKELGAWSARDNSRVLTADQFSVIQGGEVFLEYGLERVVMRTSAEAPPQKG